MAPLGIGLLVTMALVRQLGDLIELGYETVARTSVIGEFQGCNYGPIRFANGLVFECQEYKYHYAYNPEVHILRHPRTRDIAVVIDREEFEGFVYQPDTSQR